MPTLLVAILADQLLFNHPALIHAQTQAPKSDIQVVLVESHARLQLRPYQRHKLVLVLSALRHYAEALRTQGWSVRLVTADGWQVALHQVIAESHADHVITMAGAEYNARRAQERWSSWLGRPVVVLPNRQFLAADIPAASGAKRQTMEAFYRSMRTRYQLLLEADGSPIGGSWNYDAENRKPLPKNTPIPPVYRYPSDAITQQVIT